MEDVTINHLQRLTQACSDNPVLRLYYGMETQRIAAKSGKNPADYFKADNSACQFCHSRVIKATKTGRNKVKAVCCVCCKAAFKDPLIKGKRPKVNTIARQICAEEDERKTTTTLPTNNKSENSLVAATSSSCCSANTNEGRRKKATSSGRKKKDVNAGLIIPPPTKKFDSSKLAKMLGKTTPKTDRLKQMLK